MYPRVKVDTCAQQLNCDLHVWWLSQLLLQPMGMQLARFWVFGDPFCYSNFSISFGVKNNLHTPLAKHSLTLKGDWPPSKYFHLPLQPTSSF